jgi:patatin-related protein
VVPKWNAQNSAVLWFHGNYQTMRERLPSRAGPRKLRPSRTRGDMKNAAEAVVGTEFSHEVRLGLVLYGGVSLAIYMNGTTNELHRAVRGRGVYFLLKHLLDADITVDVASGASAGGINGIFLAFALANGREFGTCADLWRRDGDLGSLLRSLDGDSVPSVLDSEHYRDVLENGFRVMWDNQTHPNEPECPTPTRELDLFVTGTSFYGRYAQAVDSTGRVIETKQHRTVFLLKHRERKGSKCQLDPRRDPFGRSRADDPADLEPTRPDRPAPDAGLLAFAKLAQITSCFPGAFAAVHVDTAATGAGTPMSEADQKLKVWGDLPIGEHYFVDGGVLDNKPFTTTLDTIFHRPADRRVCRHVLYLEPDPERFSNERRHQPSGDGGLVAPSFVSSVLDSMTRLPSYESIADDLARIAEHNASIQRFDELVEGLQKSGGANPSRETYLTARLLAIGQRVNAELAEALASVEFPRSGGDAEEPTRLSSEAIGGLLRRLCGVVQALPAEHYPELLKKLDVDFYIRRLLALTYVLEKRSTVPGVGPEARELWKHVNEEIQRLEIVRSAMERVVVPPWIWAGGAGFDDRVKEANAGKLWEAIERRTLMLLDPGAPEAEAPSSRYPTRTATPAARRQILLDKDADRARFREMLEDRLKLIQKLDVGALPERTPSRTLLEESDARLRSLIQASTCDVKDFLTTFEEQEDALRFPLEFAARVRQRDQINVVRLSPFDAQNGFSKRAFEDKICGETFGHFGAFLKKSWRSNDILWGRLDGISRLVETLFLHTPFGNDGALARRPTLLAALGKSTEERRAFLGRLFPELDARLRSRPANEDTDPLSRLLAVLEATPPPAPRVLVTLLTETAQLDALCEDLPKVIGDAAEEQLEWGQRKVKGRPAAALTASKLRFSPEAWQFEVSSGALDATVLNLATRLFAERSLASMSADDVARYFRDQYAVGRESAFHTMPVTVLADLGARGAVLAERALVGSGQIGETLRKNGLYRLIVRWPLGLIAALAAFLRRSPQYRVSLVVGSLLYAALAIVANLLLAGALYEKDGVGRTFAIWAFALLPFTALVFAWIIWRSRVGKRVFVGVLLVGVVFAVFWKWEAASSRLRAFLDFGG